MRLRLYLDEDAMDQALVRALRARGDDVMTAQKAGMIERSDTDQLFDEVAGPFAPDAPAPSFRSWRETHATAPPGSRRIVEAWRSRMGHLDRSIGKSGASPREAPFVHEVPGPCGGYPVIRNTRIPVRIIGELYRQGASVEQLAGLYSHMTRAQIQGTLDFYAAHPARVDEDIERHRQAYVETTSRP